MNKTIKINLGCGPVGKDDWINVDWGMLAILHKCPFAISLLTGLRLIPRDYKVSWPGNLKLHDCRKKLPFKSASADYIYTSHFIEHLKRFEAASLLKECCRILKPGGVLRVVVPDLEALVKKYLEKDKSFFIKFFDKGKKEGELILADSFMSIFYPDTHKEKPSGTGALRSRFVRGHLWMYDLESIKSMLKAAGFKSIEQKKFRTGNTPDLEQLDSMPELSLFVEANK